MEFTQIPREKNESRGERVYMNPRWWIIGALIAVLAIAISILVLRNRAENISPVRQVENIIEETCEGEACALATALGAARAARDTSICDATATEGDANECMWQYAYGMSDPSACNQLNGEKKESCLSSTYYKMANEKSDIVMCEQIPTLQLKEVCVDELLLSYVVLDRCAEAGASRGVCDTKLAEWRALAARIDSQLCTPFAQGEAGEDGAEYVLCTQVIDNIDLDGDGLTIREEVEYGTDSNNKDTDGDSFDDGTEIRGGYNPLGQ